MNNFELKSADILPYDGEVYYYGKLLDEAKAARYYDKLLKSIPWEHDSVFIFGKLIVTKRKVAWYGDKPFLYTYSKISKTALPWTPELLELKNLIENETGETFNSCLLNLYNTGEEGMSWHRDNEKELKDDAAIASISLGAERKFLFKHMETKEAISLYLENGSVLVMKGKTQKNWLHRLPTTKKVDSPRINLTFRTIKT